MRAARLRLLEVLRPIYWWNLRFLRSPLASLLVAIYALVVALVFADSGFFYFICGFITAAYFEEFLRRLERRE